MKLDSGQLAALASIVHHGSFERAAKALHVTPSAVSQRIRAMEAQLGTVVVQRGQPCRATAAGERLCRHAEIVGLLEQEALGELASSPARGGRPTLKIAVNADSLATWFVDVLARVDHILLDLVIDNEEHSAEWLREGRVSAVVAAAAPPVTGCEQVAIGGLTYVATASPSFYKRWFASGVSSETLSQAPSLQFNNMDRLQQRWVSAQYPDTTLPIAHRLPSTHAFIDATLQGVGWAMNPMQLVADHLQQQRLVTLGQHAALDVPLVWQWSRAAEPALQTLTRTVVDVARQRLV